MKLRTCALALATWMVAFAGMAGAVFGLPIVQGGKPVAYVVTPDEPDMVAAAAAKLLVDRIKAGTGAVLTVVPEGKAPSAGPRIFIGWTRAAAMAGLSPADLTADGYILRVQDGALFLAGRDNDVKSITSFQGAKGTYLAAMRFLEDFAGVRWLMPGPQGVWTPPRTDVSVPDTLRLVHTPPLRYAMTRMDRYQDWSAANGARMPLKLFTAGGHTWVHGVPPARYAETHPDYFALIKGKRAARPDDKNPMLCTSNPDFVPLMTAWVQSKFDEGFEIVQLGQSDGYRPCECDECVRRFGDPKTTEGQGRRVLLPHLEICRRCLQSHPDKFVMLLVYSGPGQYVNLLSRDDERKVTDPDVALPFPPNVLAEVTDMDTGVLARYARVFQRITTYNYWWSTYHGGLSPKQTPSSIAERMRGLVKVGAFGTYFCGGAENWPAEAPTYYVALRAVQAPDATPDDLVKEFCAGLYGNAADAMKDYYAELYALVATKPDDGTPAVRWLFKDSPGDRQMGEKYLAFWPAERLVAMEANLRKAEANAGDDARARNWIRLARIGFDHIRLTAGVYAAERAYQAEKNAASLQKVKAALDAHRAFAEQVRALPQTDAAFVRDYFPNHKTFADSLDKESRAVPMGPPFAWNVDAALSSGKLP